MEENQLEKKKWWFVKDDEKVGPVSKNEIIELLNSNVLTSKSLVWEKKLEDWVSIEELDLNELDSNKIDLKRDVEDIEIKYVNEKLIDEKIDKALNPWFRYSARWIDYFIISFFIVPFFTVPAMVVPFVWCFIEVLLLVSFGSTPGKWLFSIKVTEKNGKLLSYSRALKRSLLVLFLGVGGGIPLLSIFTMSYAFYSLSNYGSTFWDDSEDFVVHYSPIEKSKKVILLTFFFVLLMSNVLFLLG